MIHAPIPLWPLAALDPTRSEAPVPDGFAALVGTLSPVAPAPVAPPLTATLQLALPSMAAALPTVDAAAAAPVPADSAALAADTTADLPDEPLAASDAELVAMLSGQALPPTPAGGGTPVTSKLAAAITSKAATVPTISALPSKAALLATTAKTVAPPPAAPPIEVDAVDSVLPADPTLPPGVAIDGLDPAPPHRSDRPAPAKDQPIIERAPLPKNMPARPKDIPITDMPSDGQGPVGPATPEAAEPIKAGPAASTVSPSASDQAAVPQAGAPSAPTIAGTLDPRAFTDAGAPQAGTAQDKAGTPASPTGTTPGADVRVAADVAAPQVARDRVLLPTRKPRDKALPLADAAPVAALADPATSRIDIAPASPALAAKRDDAATPLTVPLPASAPGHHQLDAARHAAWLDGLARDIAATGTPDAKLNFAVAPEKLGEVKVEVRQTDAGAAVQFTAADPQARALLADAQAQLQAEARQSGVRIAETNVGLAGQSAGGQFAGNGSGSGQSSQQPFFRTAAAAATPTTTPRDRARAAEQDRYA